MIIELKKFGLVLTSREAGREAYAAFLPTLRQISEGELVEIDFEGLGAISPSWADEFLTPLFKTYGPRLILRPTNNSSVAPTVNLLEQIHGIKFGNK
jgi:hypothetical protein